MSALRGTAIGGWFRAEQSDAPVPGGLIQQQLVAAAVGPRLYRDTECSTDGAFEPCCRSDVVWL